MNSSSSSVRCLKKSEYKTTIKNMVAAMKKKKRILNQIHILKGQMTPLRKKIMHNNIIVVLILLFFSNTV